MLKSLLCVAALSVVWAGVRAAESVKINLHIASQPLDAALQEFARQSGIQIVFFSKLTEGHQAPALEGEYTADAAMKALLMDSKLTFRVINPKTFQVSPMPVVGADESTPRAPVVGDQKVRVDDHTALEEVVISTAEGLVATRIETPLREIPQTIGIISHEQMREQNDTDLADALAHSPGITAVRTDSLDQDFYSRGFKITSFHIDGGAALFNVTGIDQPYVRSMPGVPFLGTPDLSEFDHIEVLRGSDALFGTDGNPGATVSMVRKRPLATNQLLLDAWTGSWSNNRVEIDATGPLAFDGALRGRVDGLFVDRDYFYDTANIRRRRVFAVLDADLTSSTVVTLGGSYQWDDSLPSVNGLPRNLDASDPHLARSTALTFDWSTYRTQTREIYVQLRQAVGDDWKLRFNATSWNGTSRFAYAELNGGVDPGTRTISGTPDVLAATHPNEQRQYAVDLTLSGNLEWFGHRTQLAIGGDFTRASTDLAFDYFVLPQSLQTPADNFDPTSLADPRGGSALFAVDAIGTEWRGGLFASIRAYLLKNLSVVGGARVSDNRYNDRVSVFVGSQSVTVPASFGNSRVVTPYLGVMYDLNQNFSLYASYADIYRGTGFDANGSQLRPNHGVDFEIGIKGAWLENALNGSLVLYRIEQYSIGFPGPSDQPATTVLGTNTSTGIDLELNGQVRPGWLVGSGYTYNINKAAIGGSLSEWTPRHLLKLWSSMRLPGALRRWTVSANVQAQSPNATTGNYCPVAGPGGICLGETPDYKLRQGSYAVVDLRASFEVDAHWRAALSANNVFDKVYYQTLGTPQGGNWYGEPRNLLLRIDGRF
ncbi:MAG: outer-rane receptor for ferric coprogen and ferric-rhodotorulic acid [Gammaproteobacteria bacterium]|nr:outer-rane receptor for ferric coprogen and ferric-rhodotorulic acid [Gammaproteobacteria bacterium]